MDVLQYHIEPWCTSVFCDRVWRRASEPGDIHQTVLMSLDLFLSGHTAAHWFAHQKIFRPLNSQSEMDLGVEVIRRLVPRGSNKSGRRRTGQHRFAPRA